LINHNLIILNLTILNLFMTAMAPASP